MTVLEILKKTETYFTVKGIENARLNSELLLCHILKCKRLNLYLDFDKPLTTAETDGFREYVRRRAAREPLQYITGEGHFREIALRVGPGVLVPRPETELLVDSLLRDVPDLSGRALLDMGTGSGALAVYLKKRFPECRMTACDVSGDALAIARSNGETHGTEITWVLSDLFSGLRDLRFDIILSNPPYVKTGDLTGLQEEVRLHEPQLALDGGPDGLAFYRRLLSEAPGHLLPGGLVFLEAGEGQAGPVSELGKSAGLEVIRVDKDLSGKERIVILVQAS
jgi:release factor glutamine methyltransferase